MAMGDLVCGCANFMARLDEDILSTRARGVSTKQRIIDVQDFGYV